ncbi:unnamed protein product [Fraxinus pennsylvanica]|uniref:Uncharacterized protein n=1 Tax=Fraxinus pennsylvanica TaxID=56036 RepID=A0AAD2E5X7_9LAMI|nr:unnamed protein product [Fraxinus pennsylvanica]
MEYLSFLGLTDTQAISTARPTTTTRVRNTIAVHRTSGEWRGQFAGGGGGGGAMAEQPSICAGLVMVVCRHPSRAVSTGALCAIARTISNLDDIQIQVIIDLLPCLLNFWTQKGWFPKDSTCRIISEIIRRSKDNLQAVIEAGIISLLLQVFQDAYYCKAAAEVIYNATTKGTNEQIK